MKQLNVDKRNKLGATGLSVPPIIYGTSYLGNLYQELPYSDKKSLVQGWFNCSPKPVVIDTAGKYGAGLALEMIGQLLDELQVDPADITISNKLGWYRTPLTGTEPTFEPGVWTGIKNDAVQKISYHGIIACWEQGNQLLGGKYKAKLVSVHDPDEYLMAATGPQDRKQRLQDIREAYQALFHLKTQGHVQAVGIGSKNWQVVRELYATVKFDWVMLANSFTIMRHNTDLLNFLDQLHNDQVGVINSAVFHAGFLTGGEFFDYRKVDPQSDEGQIIYPWRIKFQDICNKHRVKPADACMHFALSHPAIASMALNTSKVSTMQRNTEIVSTTIKPQFWSEMKAKGLIAAEYKYI